MLKISNNLNKLNLDLLKAPLKIKSTMKMAYGIILFQDTKLIEQFVNRFD